MKICLVAAFVLLVVAAPARACEQHKFIKDAVAMTLGGGVASAGDATGKAIANVLRRHAASNVKSCGLNSGRGCCAGAQCTKDCCVDKQHDCCSLQQVAAQTTAAD